MNKQMLKFHESKVHQKAELWIIRNLIFCVERKAEKQGRHFVVKRDMKANIFQGHYFSKEQFFKYNCYIK